MRRLTSLWALLVALAFCVSTTTAVSGVSFVYDTATVARVHARDGGVRAGLAQVGVAREVSTQPPAGPRHTSTTRVAPFVATEAAGGVANWGGEFVDDAVRAPATRPDFANISAKIERQMQTRGWTPDLIDEAVTSGNKFPAVNKLGGANTPATRYVSPTTGQSVVIDNSTGEIIQVGGPGFKYGP